MFKNFFSNPLYFLLVIFVLIISFSFWQKQRISNDFQAKYEIKINSQKIKVQIAENPEDRYKGLSGVEKLPSKNGMLFLYDELSHCSHVMRGMKFDLDFVFLKDQKVVHLKKEIPFDFKGAIQSKFLCNQVLEINSGEIEKLDIKIDDKIEIVR
jgi:uncharacterized membrane protein (UPF0127 family)